jgi:hypothetical protein
MAEKERNTKKWVTISEFEKLTGLNNKTIMSAIQRGAIPSECIDRKINDAPDTPLLFDVETVAAPEPKRTTIPYYIDSEPAAMHWYKNLNPNRQASFELREKLEKYIMTFNPDFMDNNKDDPPGMDDSTKDNMSYKEAARKEKVAKAISAELDLKEKEGSLVKKSVVYNQLFDFGQELRNAFQQLSSRITDNIIAANNNRTKIANIIDEAVATELEKLSDMDNRI